MRDAQGRLMPNDPFLREMWTLDAEHGKAGGKAVVKKYGKEHMRELARKRHNKS
jgi:hypothetical protein